MVHIMAQEESAEGATPTEGANTEVCETPQVVVGLSNTLEETGEAVTAPATETETVAAVVTESAGKTWLAQAPLVTAGIAISGAGLLGVGWAPTAAYGALTAKAPEPTKPNESLAISNLPEAEINGLVAYQAFGGKPNANGPLAPPLPMPEHEAQYLAPILTPKANELEPKQSPGIVKVASLPLEPQPGATINAAYVSDEPIAPAPQSVSPPAPIDPVEIDPAAIDLVLLAPGAVSQSVEGPQPSANQPSVPVASHLPAAPHDEASQLDVRLVEMGKRNGISVSRGPTGDLENAPPSKLAETLLEEGLPEIELEKVPLLEAIDILSTLSGVPISLEPKAMAMAGVNSDSTVAINGKDKSFQQLLENTLNAVKLDYYNEGPHVVVDRLHGLRSSKVEHELGDLADGDNEALGRLLTGVGPGQLRRGASPRGEGVVTLDASRSEHYELLIFSERLRIARGLSQKSRYPNRLLPKQPALESLDATLNRRTTFSFVHPTALTEVIGHWKRSTGKAMVVDWRSLSEAGLGPRSTIKCAATNRPWSEALDGVLEPLGLGWAPIDGDTIWITSLGRLRQEELIDFYPVSADDAEAISERLTTHSPQAGAHYDPGSESLIVRGDAAAHRGVWELVAATRQ